MSTRMLIDARHQEETRVAIVKGSRVEEFDYESTAKKQLKGNIYLARITRVEPSLQAAFVEYGGNRHGFLAFSEIHPDYYQIPVEDREELIRVEHAEERANTEAELDGKAGKDAKETTKTKKSKKEDDKSEKSDAKSDDKSDKSDDKSDKSDDKSDKSEKTEEGSPDPEKDEAIAAAEKRRTARTMRNRYSIQEVIKRRQVLLVQVVKEERGNKGAALTTYLSLAGRYCVLMPNSTHSGGISRKISNVTDRKRLKTIMSSLKLPENTGCIIRTAGLSRTKTDIKRDLNYLLRLWNGIRELTLKSMAPSLIYAEADLIKRSIRDLYNRDIDEILVEGDLGFKRAKDFMSMLMPTHAKKVQHYKNRIPLLQRYQVETQLESMYNPEVQLKSGGYVVINPTEALISIDVNSGRATKEKSIEATAVKTNLEAAEEIGRQLRLRDMAGLIVIDFIDMEDRSNNRAVERKLKEVLKHDRARIQVGRISSFGLLEMSRQRMRPNLLEASMGTCHHCNGTGVVRSVESAALHVLRELEEEGVRSRSSLLHVSLYDEVAIYVLNKKRDSLAELERRFNMEIDIIADRSLSPSAIEIEREAITIKPTSDTNDQLLMVDDYFVDEVETDSDDEDDDQETATKPRRRRRRRGGRRNSKVEGEQADSENTDNTSETDVESDDDNAKPRRRRGRRGGRRRRSGKKPETDATENVVVEGQTPKDDAKAASQPASSADEDKPARKTRTRKKPAASSDADKSDAKSDKKAAEKPARGRKKTAEKADDTKGDSPKTAEKPKRASKANPKADAKESSATKPAAKATKNKPAAKKTDSEKPDIKKADDKKLEVKGKMTTKKAAPKKAPAKKAAATKAADKPKTEKDAAEAKNDGPKKAGWWNRTFGE